MGSRSNMLLNYKTLIVGFLFTTSAFANQQLMGGNEVGNGGDVVVCSESIELLDFYESRVKNGSEITVTGATETEIIKTVLAHLKTVDQKRAELFEKEAGKFIERTNFMKGARLTDIPDSHHLFLPSQEGCKIEQIAILGKTEKKFLVNLDLWEKLNPMQKAGLIMHEVIYEHFAVLGEKNSIKARSYNSYVFGLNSKANYWNFVRGLRLPFYR